MSNKPMPPPPWAKFQDDVRRERKQLSNLTAHIGAPVQPQAANISRTSLVTNMAQVEFAGVYIVPASITRNYLFILNTGVGNMYADFTMSVGPNTRGVLIPSGGFYEPFVVPLTGVTISGTGVVLTGNLPGS